MRQSIPSGVNVANTSEPVYRAAILDALKQPFLLLDHSGTITYANSGAHEKLQYSKGELVGVNIARLDHSLNEELWQQLRDTVLAEGELQYESHITTTAGKVMPFEFQLQKCNQGETAIISAFAFDIASRKDAEGDIIGARESAMEYADQLHEKTQVAEKALAAVQKLKQKQDGDYYLTAMLLEPFRINSALGERVQIDWLVRQKTKFTYRQWASEIGGDFCNAESIELRGRKYTFFVIADAMGKAIQGASGALILATIISTYIRRTRKAPHLSGLYPERWLRLLHEELRSGFEGFDGQMMIATAAGVIDEQSLCLYYFNAEQPRPVSYVNGSVEFIGGDSTLAKIGMPGKQDDFVVEVIRLRPGECILFGSDGRDDVKLRTTGEINYDDSFFPDMVGQSMGDLDEIYETTAEQGEIIDDYSLLRINIPDSAATKKSATAISLMEYFHSTGETDALLKIIDRNPTDSVVLAKISNDYLRHGDLVGSISFLQRYLDMRPDDLKANYSLVRQCLASSDLEAAADAAERIMYRTCAPDDRLWFRKILTLLAAIYKRNRNPRCEIINLRLRYEFSETVLHSI